MIVDGLAGIQNGVAKIQAYRTQFRWASGNFTVDVTCDSLATFKVDHKIEKISKIIISNFK